LIVRESTFADAAPFDRTQKHGAFDTEAVDVVGNRFSSLKAFPSIVDCPKQSRMVSLECIVMLKRIMGACEKRNFARVPHVGASKLNPRWERRLPVFDNRVEVPTVDAGIGKVLNDLDRQGVRISPEISVSIFCA
jgi:hypothetical protein